jgi:hypothetical protein
MADIVSEAEVTAFWPGFDDVDSTAQTLLLAAASAAVRKFCGREFATPASGTELYDGDGSPHLFLRRFPVSSVSAVSVNGASVADYKLDATRGVLTPGGGKVAPWDGGRWTAGTQNISVTYTGGPSAVPEPVKLATIALIRDMKERVDSGAFRRERIGDYEYELAGQDLAAPGRMPAMVEMLLTPYRAHRYA